MRPRPLQVLFARSAHQTDRFASDLRAFGLTIHESTSPARAAAIVLKQTLDVILVDLNDDDPGALLLIATLGRGRDGRGRKVPVVAWGGSASGRVAALERGALGALPADASGVETAALLRSLGQLSQRRRADGHVPEADAEHFGVRVGDRSATLTPTEWKIFTILASEPERCFTLDELLELVWSHELDPTSTVSVHIHRLRKKIEPNPSAPALIRTVRGRGYAFHPPSARGTDSSKSSKQRPR